MNLEDILVDFVWKYICYKILEWIFAHNRNMVLCQLGSIARV